jgi:RND family efflux transporter, MFP subunit
MKTTWFYCTLCILLLACSSKKEEQADENASATVVEDKIAEVSVTKLEYTDFSHELIANGTVSAQNKAELRFQTSEIVSAIYVKNGDRVKKGQKIAMLDPFKLQSNLEQAKDNFARTRLDLQDVLIGQGYSLSDTANIPEESLQLAKVRSNYNQSQNNYIRAEYDYKQSVLYAPFDGVVANLFAKVHNPPGSDPFCIIIDNQHPEVTFNVLENELPLININDKVLVSPFSQTAFTVEGHISEINPIVDRNGMIKVKATIRNKDNKFYEGMNVKVRVQRLLGKQLVIPKTALVLRTNKKVVFKLENDRAVWVYVETAQENSDSYVVTSGLNDGDMVIYEGNINLAHETPVVIRN